jgi:ABC-type phosphate/phosphonate transport system permease subunit
MIDADPTLHLAPPVLTPAGPSKRLPNPQAVRWRYRLAQWVSVAFGGLVAAVVIEVALANLTSRGLAPDQLFYALALLVLVVGLGVPWLVVKVLWLWKRRRHDWGP